MFCNSHPRSEDKVSQGASRLRERADVAGRAAAKVFLLLTREMVSITSLALKARDGCTPKVTHKQGASKDKASDRITFLHV